MQLLRWQGPKRFVAGDPVRKGMQLNYPPLSKIRR